ncbi:hypothetical protein CORC01_01294 [Colletotrichum orchidophilum]|uniref:Uncharacterized protein n=1 Tax=Colletotrichum orchidophilum TaxID=1209926 RepID=A0A1G4BQG8_9PEZI|nr:uncharacterized protein CORC01_01294 [Colletotrichum orchidophilum]OHF03575.1 hypothetical protein CORC01_01294 [Colletotrichum orchidophilum]
MVPTHTHTTNRVSPQFRTREHFSMTSRSVCSLLVSPHIGSIISDHPSADSFSFVLNSVH